MNTIKYHHKFSLHESKHMKYFKFIKIKLGEIFSLLNFHDHTSEREWEREEILRVGKLSLSERVRKVYVNRKVHILCLSLVQQPSSSVDFSLYYRSDVLDLTEGRHPSHRDPRAFEFKKFTKSWLQSNL